MSTELKFKCADLSRVQARQPLDDCASVEVYGVYTMVRSPTSVLCVGEGLDGASILDTIFGPCTMVRNLTNVLIAVKPLL